MALPYLGLDGEEWISSWHAVNSEKTIFMKTQGKDLIVYGLFVDDIMHILTYPRLQDELIRKYSKNFDSSTILDNRICSGFLICGF